MPSESVGNRRGQAVPRTSLGISNYSALFSPPHNGTLQGRPPPSHSGGRPLFYAGCIKSRPMAGRFAPPPIVRAYARCRLLVLRTMHRRLTARRFAPSPYAGADAPRHRPAHPPLPLHYPHPENRHDGPPFFGPRFVDSRTHMRRRSAQNGSLPSSDTMDLAASATFLPGNTPLSRKVRRLRSVISMPPDFNTSCI